MNRIPLATTGRTTSQLGFGCSSLMSAAAGRKASLALLEHAYDAGIRHFDVAPMYGYGAAEACLGEFLSRHPDATVTTKYGIPPPKYRGLLRITRRIAGSALTLIPAVKRKLATAANAVTAAAPKAPFTATAARASLDRSLAALRTARIDLFLLHEVEAEDLTDDALLIFLQGAVQAGQVGAFGCGSGAEKIPALLAHKPEYCPVLQFEWSVFDHPPQSVPAFTLHHRTLTAHFAELCAALERTAATRSRWSSQIGADLAQPGMLAALMLKAALVFNPDSVILVSSRNPRHIAENVRVAGDNTLLHPARAFYSLIQREGAHLLQPPSEGGTPKHP